MNGNKVLEAKSPLPYDLTGASPNAAPTWPQSSTGRAGAARTLPTGSTPVVTGVAQVWGTRAVILQCVLRSEAGLTDAEMADFFGVSTKTFTRWKLSRPEFCRALKAGKEIADARAERRLYERAVGYSVDVEKIICRRGRVIRIKTVEHHPPDTTACIFWLKNRQPEKWSYKFKVKQAAAQWNFIGLMPTEEEWTARYCSHPEPLIIPMVTWRRWLRNTFLRHLLGLASAILGGPATRANSNFQV